jgi:hypothetical protein
MQSLEKKLSEASSFLNGLRSGNGKPAENTVSWHAEEKTDSHRR